MNFAVSIPGTPVAAPSTTDTAQHRKLTAAAQQFEGMLLQEMLKPMKEHGFCQEENEDKTEGSGFGDTLSSFGTEAVATAIAKGGGLGIAKRVVEKVEGEQILHAAKAKREGSPAIP